jgi:DNA polymerase elongation subunit (family B)
MRKSFMCSEGYDHIIAAGRECVASRGIFVTPKRYVLNLVNLDGYDCDKLKVMGLDTKKTILPVYIQDALNAFIERYLKGEEWEDVAVDVVQLKDDLEDPEKTDLFQLGLPKGVNKVEYYTEQLELHGAGARLPGHVAASIYYNQKRAENKDLESLEIVSSMKIRVFYLKEPDGRFKSIALPGDTERVPQWFLDQINVDKRKQITRLVDNPLENILKAVGKVPPSRQTLFIDSVLEF